MQCALFDERLFHISSFVAHEDEHAFGRRVPRNMLFLQVTVECEMVVSGVRAFFTAGGSLQSVGDLLTLSGDSEGCTY